MLLSPALACRGGQAPQQLPGAPAEPAAGEHEDAAAGAAAAAGDSDASLPADTTFAPVNTLPWEERICWEGARQQPAGGGGESEHETDDEGSGPAQPAPLREQQVQWAHPAADGADQQLGEDGESDGDGAEQQQQWDQAGQEGYAAPADIAAVFGAAPASQQQQGSMQFENGLPVVLGGGGGGLPLVQPQGGAGAGAGAGVPAWQQPLGGELPGLTSVTAAEMEARAAAESDEEEYWSLPSAPLLRLEQLYAYQRRQAAEAGGDGGERRPLLPAPDMLPGAPLAVPGRGCGLSGVHLLVSGLLPSGLKFFGLYVCPCLAHLNPYPYPAMPWPAVHRDAWERRIAWEGVGGAHKLRCADRGRRWGRELRAVAAPPHGASGSALHQAVCSSVSPHSALASVRC